MGGIASLCVGDVIAGKYRIDRVVGAGGMGIVIAATHLNLQQTVAIKLTHGTGTSSKDRERFMREARAIATLASEHCVRIQDVDTLPTGEPYAVMELLTGVSVKELLEEQKVLHPATACGIVLEALDAIAEAHARGIVHRDLKPANLFYAERSGRAPIVKVLDFGISKLIAETDTALTGTHELMGSPAYMAPEQFQSARGVDPRADIWSLGVILYELVTGRTPFPAASAPDLFVKIATAPPVPLRELVALPPELEAIIYRCLQKDPSQRFSSANELAAALRPVALEQPAAPVLPRRSNGPITTGPSLGVPLTSLVTNQNWTSTAAARAAASPFSPKYVVPSIAAVVIVAIVATAWVVASRPTPPIAATAAPTTATATNVTPAVAEPSSAIEIVEAPKPSASTATTQPPPRRGPAVVPARQPASKKPHTPDIAPSSMTNW